MVYQMIHVDDTEPYSSNDRSHHLPCSSFVTELTEIDALPRAEVQSAVSNGDIDAHASYDALRMDWHVVRAFEDVTVVRHFLRYEPVVNSFHVTPHVRVPVLAYAQRATRMLHKEIEQSRLWQLRQVPEHFIRYQMEAAGLRLQLKCNLLYHQNFISFIGAENEQNCATPSVM